MLIQKKICILSADAFSGHTFKRAQMLHSLFKVVVIGFLRSGKNPDAKMINQYEVEIAGNVVDKKYWKRLGSYFNILKHLKRHRPEIVLARGSDMQLIGGFYKILLNRNCRIVAEITDVYAISYARWYSPVIKMLEKAILLRSNLVAATSQAFFNYYGVKREKQLYWENTFQFSFSKSGQNEFYSAKMNEAKFGNNWHLQWSGYFRCKYTLMSISQIVMRNNALVFDLYGYANGGDIHQEEIESLTQNLKRVRYHGPYQFPAQLPDIFLKTHFTVVSERGLHNINSTLCLSNRIYESAAHYTPCVSVGASAISTYVVENKIGLSFESFEELEHFLAGLNEERYLALYAQLDFEGFAANQRMNEQAVLEMFRSLADDIV